MRLLAMSLAAAAIANCQIICLAQSFDAPASQTDVVQPWGESFGDLQLPALLCPAQSQQQQANMAKVGSPISATASAARPNQSAVDRKPNFSTPTFSNNEYLNGVGSGRPPVGLYNPQQFGFQGNSFWTPAPGATDYISPWNKGVLEDKINPADTMDDLKNQLRVGPLPTHEEPAWAKQKIDVRHFQDGQEHFGNLDPYGFSDQ